MKKALWMALLTALAAAGWWLVQGPHSAGRGVGEAVAPADLGQLNGDLQGPVRAALARIAAAPEDAQARGELAQLYHANGLLDLVEPAYLQALGMRPEEAKWWYLLALHRRERGDLAGAVEACRETVSLAPSYIAARRTLGDLLVDLGRPEAALEVYGEARRLEPEHPANAVGLARVHLQLQHWERAADLLRGVLERQPDYGHAHMLLGRAYLGLGELDQARLSSARGAPPPQFDAWAVELRTQRVGYSGVMKEAQRLFDENNDDAAIRLLVGLREEHPDDAMLLSNLAAAYGRKGEVDSMLAILNEALRSHPEHYPTHLNLAYGYASKGDQGRALEHVDRALELNPALSAAHALRSELCAALGDSAGALASMEKAVELQGAAPRLRIQLGQLLYQAGAFERAVEVFAELVRAEPSSLKGHHWLARSLAAAGRVEEAAGALEAARRLDPDHRAHADVQRALDEAVRPGDAGGAR